MFDLLNLQRNNEYSFVRNDNKKTIQGSTKLFLVKLFLYTKNTCHFFSQQKCFKEFKKKTVSSFVSVVTEI